MADPDLEGWGICLAPPHRRLRDPAIASWMADTAITARPRSRRRSVAAADPAGSSPPDQREVLHHRGRGGQSAALRHLHEPVPEALASDGTGRDFPCARHRLCRRLRVILSRGHAAEALTWTKAVMAKLGLTLNEAKTSLKDARRESFDFLGYTLGPRHFPNGGRWYLGASPSKQSVQRVKAKISDLLVPGNKGAWDEVRARLNRILRGWSAYFAYGALASAYEAVDRHVYDRARNFLRQRHKAHGRGVDRFSREHIYGERPVHCLRRESGRSSPWALQ